MTKNSKISNHSQQTDGQGISSLPNPWKTIVNLIGTFGLAVFLVVWYLVKMQPDEAARYKNISKEVTQLSVNVSNLSVSVGELNQLIRTKQTILTKTQADNLKKLYIATVSNELNLVICNILKKYNTSIGRETIIKDLIDEMQKIMTAYAAFVDDLIEFNRNTIKGEIAKQIGGKEGVCERIAIEAIDEWKDKTPHEISEKLNWSLQKSFNLTLKSNNATTTY